MRYSVKQLSVSVTCWLCDTIVPRRSGTESQSLGTWGGLGGGAMRLALRPNINCSATIRRAGARSILHAGCVMTRQPSRQRVRALRTRGPFELEPPRCITLGRAEATDRRSHSHAARVCSQLTRAARPPTQDVYTGDNTLSQIG